MASNRTDTLTIPPALENEIRVAAAIAHRPPEMIVSDALEQYLAELRTRPAPNAEARAAAAARIREQRKDNLLPDGMTIEDVIAWGREGRA